MSSWTLAQVVLEQLLEAGTTDVVLSPGSRNAPLSILLAHAETSGRVRLHVRIDERSAGFLALGLAKASGRPVAVVTTSGTAVGNLMPAVMEAHHSAVPLVVVSADRPELMRHAGSNQTTDQAGIFGAFALAGARLSSLAGDPASWRFALRRALHVALGTRTLRPGPVQLNCEFAEPLMPDAEVVEPASELFVSPVEGDLLAVLDDPLRTVVLVGDAAPGVGATARQLAEACGWPLLSEPSGNARAGANAIATYRLLLGREGLRERIERVIVHGRPTLSRPVGALLRRRDLEIVMVAARSDWVDPGFAACMVVDGIDVDAQPHGDPSWLTEWQQADVYVLGRVSRLVSGLFCGQVVAAAVLSSLGGDDQLVVGSSNAVRDLDLAPIHPDGPVVWANRGLAGIDGLVSTARGVALATGAATTCLVGDLTFLHDIGGLWSGVGEPRPDLRYVVVDDRGGSIFHTLEQGAPEHSDSFERVFGTPHDVDLVEVASGYGVPASRVTSLDDLVGVLATPPQGVEVVVAQVERAGRRDLDASLRAAALK